MVESSYVKNVNKEIKYIHEFSNIKFNITDNIRPYTDKYNLRNTESYETGNIINNLRKPIENGDIFDIDNKYYVLVAQPCDLMIRTRGGKRNTQIATLLKITTVPYDEDKIIKLIQPGNKYALYYFVKEKTDVGIVSFKNYLMVDMNLLDLCVFNASGECKTINDLKNYDLDYLCMGWEKRFKVINAKINSLKMKLNVVNNLSIMPHLHKIINRKYYPRIVIYASELNPHGVNVENGIYDFHVKRISKVKEPTSNYLLEIYTQYLSRKAYQHDYAKRND
jgi:hypothetical protein